MALPTEATREMLERALARYLAMPDEDLDKMVKVMQDAERMFYDSLALASNPPRKIT